MPMVVALLERRPALLAVRRAFPGRPQRVLTARSPKQLDTFLRRHLVDAVILGPDAVRTGTLAALRDEFASLPVACLVPLRSDDAALVRRVARAGALLLVEGLDEPVLEREIRRRGLTARREDALLPLADTLDLIDPLQRAAWAAIVADAPAGLATAGLAERLGVRRETLSRRFGAGMAPSLKAAVDAVRLVAAGQLLGCRGLRVAEVAALLGYSSTSLLQRSCRRLVGPGVRALGALPPEAVVARALGRPTPRWP
ncbi:MAG: helix-turn-helix domain-containing protein, partial [Gemmatimonadetes bacterium]|nr:helix-turn-helix domain-containing protein [Gemmatimonadota bacterium]HPF61921.1 helix-turn-helix domain-containing protein [Gemmatimonadales bacterium]